MPLPPHSLHTCFRLPCGQTPLPPHSFHVRFCLPCRQMPLPPHSFSLALLPPVCANAAAATLFTLVPLPDPPVLADTAAATLFTPAFPPPMFTFRSLPAAPVAGGRRAALPRRSTSIHAVRLLGQCAVLRVRSKPVGPLRIAGSHASSDGSGLIGFAAAAEQARQNDSYATTRHYSSI
jgi:hypothetical protein